MRNVARVLAFALVAPLLCGSALGADERKPRVVTVCGDAEVKVVPDEVVLVLGVETFDKEMSRAKEENDRRVKKIVGLAVELKHVKTDHISIEPRYRHSHERRDFLGYLVRKTVVFTVKDISKFENLLSAALEAGATHVHGVRFRTAELRKHRDKARALAVRAAKEKATDLARELDQRIGRPRAIVEEHLGWWYPHYGSGWGSHGGRGMGQNVAQSVGGGRAVGDGSLALGQISVTARVRVTFEIED